MPCSDCCCSFALRHVDSLGVCQRQSAYTSFSILDPPAGAEGGSAIPVRECETRRAWGCVMPGEEALKRVSFVLSCHERHATSTHHDSGCFVDDVMEHNSRYCVRGWASSKCFGTADALAGCQLQFIPTSMSSFVSLTVLAHKARSVHHVCKKQREGPWQRTSYNLSYHNSIDTCAVRWRGR